MKTTIRQIILKKIKILKHFPKSERDKYNKIIIYQTI